MAMTKAVPTALGVDAVYWRIVSVEVQHDAKVAGVTLAGYASQAAREAGAVPLMGRHIVVPASALPDDTVHDVKTADLYTAITALVDAAPSASNVGGTMITAAADPLAGAVAS